MITKTKRIDLLASESDEQNLRKAAARLGTSKISKVIFKSVEQVANQPVEYYSDKVAIRQVDNNIEYGRNALERVIKKFSEVTGEILTLLELETMFTGRGQIGGTSIIEEAIRVIASQKLYNQLKRDYSGMPVNIDTVLDDKDLTDLFKAANDLTKIPEIRMQDVIYYQCYKISESGEVSILPDQVERIKGNHRLFASTPEELQRLAGVKNICELLNSFLGKNLLPENILSTFYYNREAGSFLPTGEGIKVFVPPSLLD